MYFMGNGFHTVITFAKGFILDISRFDALVSAYSFSRQLWNMTFHLIKF